MLRHAQRFAALALLLAANAWAGITFTSVTKTEGMTMPGAALSTITSTVKMDGDKLRMDAAGEHMGHGPFRGYFLTKDAGKTMYMVNAEDKTYMEWDTEKLMGGGAAQMARSMMQLKFTNVKVEKLLEEAGGNLLGYPTTHYKIRTSYKTEMNMFGHSAVNNVVQDEEIWAAPKVTGAAMNAWSKKQLPGTGDDGLDKLMREQQDKIKGLPLRRIATSTQTDASGKQQTTKTTMDVTKIEEGNVDAATFEIPAGYQLMQMPDFGAMGGMGNKGIAPTPPQRPPVPR